MVVIVYLYYRVCCKSLYCISYKAAKRRSIAILRAAAKASGHSKKECAFIISNNNETPASEVKFTLSGIENSPVINLYIQNSRRLTR